MELNVVVWDRGTRERLLPLNFFTLPFSFNAAARKQSDFIDSKKCSLSITFEKTQAIFKKCSRNQWI